MRSCYFLLLAHHFSISIRLDLKRRNMRFLNARDYFTAALWILIFMCFSSHRMHVSLTSAHDNSAEFRIENSKQWPTVARSFWQTQWAQQEWERRERESGRPTKENEESACIRFFSCFIFSDSAQLSTATRALCHLQCASHIFEGCESSCVLSLVRSTNTISTQNICTRKIILILAMFVC